MSALWPVSARQTRDGALQIGGCALPTLAQQFGTPLYIFDEETLRAQARAYRAALAQHYPGTAQVAYASKAFLCTAIAQLFAEEGLDLDVVSGGELYVALRAGFPAGRIHFHGNNKSREELTQALAAGVGRIVVDNFHELALLEALTQIPDSIPIWLRLAPGVSAHTHNHIRTGQEDTKFGFSIAAGDAARAVARALAAPGLTLVGLHSHIGSQIYEPEALADAATVLLAFAAAMRHRYGFTLRELSPGGGWGVPMIETDPPAPVAPYVAALSAAVVAGCQQHGLPLPHLVLEPGRSLIAQAGVALYCVGARKKIPGVRTYVAVDGGMADNIRPALYGAKYSAQVSGGRGQGPGVRDQAAADNSSKTECNTQSEVVTIAGKFCESGDVLIHDIALPRLEPGDLLAVPMAGAYTLSMASNYNLAPRPAVVLAREGQARLIQRRETYADLIARDLPLIPTPMTQTPETGSGLRSAQYEIRDTQHAARFTKYHAHGNDYLVLDPADWPTPPAAKAIRDLCDRRRGVGADGVLWGPTSSQAPLTPGTGGGRFALRLFNPDGSEFEISGNGLRIFARYLWDRRLPAGPEFTIETPAGPVIAHVLDAAGDRITLALGRLSFRSAEIGLAGPSQEVIEEPVVVAGQQLRITAVTIGNPHCVVFADGPGGHDPLDLTELSALAHTFGPALERLPLFPNRTNVQFVRVVDAHTLAMAIWERGAGYTLASGSSSCAAAGAAIRTGRCASPVTVHMPGGQMLVEVADDWTVRLTGTVTFVCSGSLDAKELYGR